MTDRRTGGSGANVDVALTVDRRTGSTGATVDLALTVDRRIGAVGIQVDYKPPDYFLNVSATQSQSVSVSLVVTPGGIPLTVTAVQGQAVSLTWRNPTLTLSTLQLVSASLIRRTFATRALTVGQTATGAAVRVIIRQVSATVSQAVSFAPRVTTLIRRLTVAPTPSVRRAAQRTFGLAVTVAATGRKQVNLPRLLTQAQTVSITTRRGYQRIVTATQGLAVRLQRTIQLTRAMTGSHRVSTSVRLSRTPVRVLVAAAVISVRLLRQITLGARTVTQAQSVARSGLPVTVRLISTVQARSLALVQAGTLTRAIAVNQAAALERLLGLVHTLTVPTSVSRELHIDVTHAITQGTAVALEMLDVTPFYEVLVTTTVGQNVTLSMAGTGKPARHFLVLTRNADFVIAGRHAEDFAVPRRGVRFLVEDRA